MNNIFIKSMPEQVAQNTVDIDTLKKVTQPSACDIDLSNNTTSVSATHITPTIDVGFILDIKGNLYKILSYNEDTLLYNVQFMCDISEEGPQGPIGPTGNGIASITLTGTAGLVDTYTITYTNGTTSTFTVTNGAQGPTGNGISTISLTSSAGLVDTYTITFTDGTTTTFTVTNGAQGNPGATGNGISSITKTGTSGNVDTYTILYTNGTTSTFTVTNGTGAITRTNVVNIVDIINTVRWNQEKFIKMLLHTTGNVMATFKKYDPSTNTLTTSLETFTLGNTYFNLKNAGTSGISFANDKYSIYVSTNAIHLAIAVFSDGTNLSWCDDIDITSIFTSADIDQFV